MQQDKKVPILLKNVDIKVNKYTKKLEVVVQRYSQVTTSSKQFHITDIDAIGAKTILLKELSTIKEFDKSMSKSRLLLLRFSLEAIGSLEIGESYYITKLTVRGEYSVSMPAKLMVRP